MKKLLPLLSLALLLAGCGSKLTPENWAKIQNGTEEAEVLRILGKPARLEGGSLLGVTGTIYSYEEKDKRVQVIFVNGKVLGKQGSL